MNTHVPALVAERFKALRIVVFSTLCVYPFAPITGGGWSEDTQPTGSGDYVTSCVSRERMFSYFSRRHNTPRRIIRLNYAIDMRYGVLHDIAGWVRDGIPIPIGTAYVSVIWQGDSNAQILGALAHVTTPTSPLNVGGAEHMSVRLCGTGIRPYLWQETRFRGPGGRGWLVQQHSGSAAPVWLSCCPSGTHDRLGSGLDGERRAFASQTDAL